MGWESKGGCWSRGRLEGCEVEEGMLDGAPLTRPSPSYPFPSSSGVTGGPTPPPPTPQVASLSALTALTSLRWATTTAYFDDLTPAATQAHTLTSLTALRVLEVSTRTGGWDCKQRQAMREAVSAWAVTLPHLRELRLDGLDLDTAATEAVLYCAPSLRQLACGWLSLTPGDPEQPPRRLSRVQHIECQFLDLGTLAALRLLPTAVIAPPPHPAHPAAAAGAAAAPPSTSAAVGGGTGGVVELPAAEQWHQARLRESEASGASWHRAELTIKLGFASEREVSEGVHVCGGAGGGGVPAFCATLRLCAEVLLAPEPPLPRT